MVSAPSCLSPAEKAPLGRLGVSTQMSWLMSESVTITSVDIVNVTQRHIVYFGRKTSTPQKKGLFSIFCLVGFFSFGF